jgi:ribosomal protein S18 acetylase RimI-like enzyme
MARSTIDVRPARPDEFEALGRLCVAAYAGVPGEALPPAYASVLEDIPARLALGAEVLAAHHPEAGVVGCVTLVLEDGPLFEHRYGVDGDCSFRMLAVDPAAQGLGAGRALVDACLDRCRAAGRRRIVIASTPAKVTARGLYESLGFARVPEVDLDVHPGGEHVRLWSFALDL